MEAQVVHRKKKYGRLRRRMRRALARLGRRLSRNHVTDDAQVLVGNEQRPEIELELETVVATSSKPEVDIPTLSKKKRRSIFVKLLTARKSFRRRKSTSGSKPEINPGTNGPTTPATSCSGLVESDVDRLIEFEPEPEAEKSITDDVTLAGGQCSTAAILEDKSGAESGEKLQHHGRDMAGGRAEVDDVTKQDGGKKKHRKRKRAKRYAKQAGVKAWKGIRTSWKFFSSSMAVLTKSPALTVNATSGIIQVWQQWQGTHSNYPQSTGATR